MSYRINQTKPDIAVISLGLNDIKNSGGIGATNYLNNITSIINKIREINSNTYFLVNNVIPAFYINDNAIKPYNDELNSKANSLSTDNSIVVVNYLYTNFNNLKQNRNYYEDTQKRYDLFYAQEGNHLLAEVVCLWH